MTDGKTDDGGHQSDMVAISGIGQLTAMLSNHLKLQQSKDKHVDEIISTAQTSQSLKDAKRKAIQTEKQLLLSIMEDIDEMNTFLKNIILIENLFNKVYQPHKQKQEEARKKHASNISKYEDKSKVQSEANSFVELIFGGQTHISSFQQWIDKVVKQCNIQNIKISKNSGAKCKKIERAFYKAFYVYPDKNGYKQMTDILRCSLVFDNFENLYKCFSVIEILAEQTSGGILRVKDRYHPTTMPFGYRDLLINIFCPESRIVAEIQLHFVEFYKYKTISHKMYKRARLFERETQNMAYEYATKYLRPKIGTFQTYEVSKDEMVDEYGNEIESKDNTEKKPSELKYNELLTEWGLTKYIKIMEENGWDDVQDWNELTDNDLINDMGFAKGHIKKFRRNYKKWCEEVKNENIAIFQEQVYGNIQPKLQLEKKQFEQKQDDNINGENDYKCFIYKHGYIPQGNDIVEKTDMSVGEAKKYALTLNNCTGITFSGDNNNNTKTRIWFKKNDTSVSGGGTWHSYLIVNVNHQFDYKSGYIPQGNDICTKNMTILEAKKYAMELSECTGITFNAENKDNVKTNIWFKKKTKKVGGGGTWHSYIKKD